MEAWVQIPLLTPCRVRWRLAAIQHTNAFHKHAQSNWGSLSHMLTLHWFPWGCMRTITLQALIAMHARWLAQNNTDTGQQHRLATSNNRHQDVSQIRLKTVNTCVSYADICQHLRDHFDNVWNTRYQSDPKGTSYKAVFPRRRKEDLRVVQTDTATSFRLRTGHCKLHLHLFRLGLHQDGLCDACHTLETIANFLLVCPQYHAQRAILLAKLRNIGVTTNTADILRNPGASCLVQHFVDATNRTLWTE